MTTYAATPTVLRPNVVNKTVSRLKVINTLLQDIFGMGVGVVDADAEFPQNPSAWNVNQDDTGRNFSYDVFSGVQTLAKPSVPGAPSLSIAPNPVGNVTGVYPRLAEKMPLLLEKLNNQRPIGGPAGDLDVGGAGYITRQQRMLKQRIVNTIEFQIAAMLRGSYTYTATSSGQIAWQDFTGGSHTVAFQVPSGNLSKLDMLGAGDIIATSWDNVDAPILDDIAAIEAAMAQIHGLPLSRVLINSVGMGYVLGNNQVKSRAGTSNVPWLSNVQIPGTNSKRIVLAGCPHITWEVVNETLKLGASDTATKLIADTQATFIPEPSPDWVEYRYGAEPIAEILGNTTALRKGPYFWTERITDPAGWALHSVHNGIPCLYVPGCVATGLIRY